jgi:transcriptional regulator with XRE-family HTH domain
MQAATERVVVLHFEMTGESPAEQQPEPKVAITQPARYCTRCGGRLARDNTGKQCSACRHTGCDALVGPPKVPRAFWDIDQMRDALATWHIGRVIFAYRTHPHHGRSLPQETVGNWLGLTQAQLSRIENGRAPEELTKLVRWAQILGIPADLLWFELPDEPGTKAATRSPRALALPVILNGRSVLLPIDIEAAKADGLGPLLKELTASGQAIVSGAGGIRIVAGRPVAQSMVAHALPTGDLDELQRVAAALDDARKYMDDSVLDYFGEQLHRSKSDDGNLGAGRALPFVLGILGAISEHVRDVKPPVRGSLLSLGADGAEFVGWLYRDLQDHVSAAYWYDRAMEWAQAANDTAMQGYVLLKKSQMAYDERDALRVSTLAEAAQHGPWQLPIRVRAEVIQQEALGMAMLGEPLSAVQGKIDTARQLLADIADDEPDDRFGAYFTAETLMLRCATCYTEAGKPARAAALFDEVIGSGALSRRDAGFFRARRATALALSGEPDEAAAVGLQAVQVAKEISSGRTIRVLIEVVRILGPWSSRPGPRALKEAVTT